MSYFKRVNVLDPSNANDEDEIHLLDGQNERKRRILDASTTKKYKKIENPVISTLSNDKKDDEKPEAKQENERSYLNEELSARFTGETVHLGTHIFQPTEDIVFTNEGLHLVAPHCEHPTEKTVLNIQKSEIVKLVCNFSQKSVIIVHVMHTCGKYIRECLGMSLTHLGNGYFSPMAKKPAEKRIIIEARLDEAAKSKIKSFFPSHVLEEISQSDISNFLNKKQE